MTERLSNKEFNEKLRNRTKELSIKILSFCSKQKKTDEFRVISRQLMRSATSVAANYRAATRGRSQREFYAKMCIVVEEADETQFWLEMLEESNMVDTNKVKLLHAEVSEITALVTSIKASLAKRFKDS